MNKEIKKYIISTIVGVGLMFVWIVLTVFLTGGRDVSDFTNVDYMIFSCFIFIEVLTLAGVIVALFMMQKHNKMNNINIVKNSSDPSDRYIKGMHIASFFAIIATWIGGILTKRLWYTLSEDFVGAIAVTAFLLPIVFLIVNVVFQRMYIKKLKQQSFAEKQQYWVSQRDHAEDIVENMRNVLNRLVWIHDVYGVCLAVCAFAAAYFCGVISKDGDMTSIVFVCYLVLSAAALRIRLKTSKQFFEENKGYVCENDYPYIYGLARKAAIENGLSSNIKIAVLDDFNAGVAKIGDTISIQLGALLLNELSDAELYCVLLHECSHIKNEMDYEKIDHYFRTQHNNMFISKYLFAFLDAYFNEQYGLYCYTVSLIRENEADKAMMIGGNNEIAASALIKMKYYDLYDWEKGTYDTPCALEPEEYDIHSLKKEGKNFKEAVERCAEKWNVLINKEILSRSATHPTLKMRLATLGVDKLKVLYPDSLKEYISEREKAIEHISSLIAENNKENYTQLRRYYYTEPKELIEKWENDHRRITAEGYRDVCEALRHLGRNSEALELCENAIAQLDDIASCYARYMKGCYLLHSFDETGIDYIYKAIEINHNYLEEGIMRIGRFCCITGQEDQLEIYRERALALAEKNSIYAECNVLNKKDRLIPESLPDGMLEDILAYITAEDSDEIEKIYLVRKVITEDFFTSVFVIKMDCEIDDDVRYDILHRVFNYLDTCSDWQFSLFDYDDVRNVKVENIKGSCVYAV